MVSHLPDSGIVSNHRSDSSLDALLTTLICPAPPAALYQAFGNACGYTPLLTFRIDAQAPLRAQISTLADQFIRDSWGGARKLNKKSSPRFAADVLLHVRRRFYARIEKEGKAFTFWSVDGDSLVSRPAPSFFQISLLLLNYWLIDFGTYTNQSRCCCPGCR